jgi:hypothetical protein
MTKVSEDQFDISDEGIEHTPTGYKFKPYPGNPYSGSLHKGMLGSVLPNGEDYRPHEVEQMSRRLWNEYVEQNENLKPSTEKFTVTSQDGTTDELEVAPSKINTHHPLLTDLQKKLLRLKPGEQLKLAHGYFDAVSEDLFEVHTCLGSIAITNGCGVLFESPISETDPKARGYIFTRYSDVPLMDFVEPEGGKQ